MLRFFFRLGDDADCGDCVVDFEQPRALWSKVWDDKAREAYVQNVAGHFKGVKSAEIKARQRTSLFCPCIASSPSVA